MIPFRSILLTATLTLCAATAHAQGAWQSHTTTPPAAKTRSNAPPPSAAKPAPEQAQQPLQQQVQYLVRTTLLTLNDANRTGNYTVLRDIAAPSFRERNSAADLAQVFAEMRRARLDLSTAALLSPELDEQPSLDADRRFRLKGSLPTQPNRIVFDLVLESVQGQWQLHGISIATRPSRTAAGGPAPAAR